MRTVRRLAAKTTARLPSDPDTRTARVSAEWVRPRGTRRRVLGDEVVYGEPGGLIFKPRGQWHTFWNDDTEPAILEMISPAGFERYFEEMVLEAGPPNRAR